VAAAIAAGVGIDQLVNHFESQNQPSGDGYYDDLGGVGDGGPVIDYAPPGGPDGPIIDYAPPGGSGFQEQLPWWSYTQNLTAKDMRGRGRRRNKPAGENDGRRARAEIVRRVMAEQGLGMIQASKYVKENGLY
jgi:hypothetical protein